MLRWLIWLKVVEINEGFISRVKGMWVEDIEARLLYTAIFIRETYDYTQAAFVVGCLVAVVLIYLYVEVCG